MSATFLKGGNESSDFIICSFLSRGNKFRKIYLPNSIIAETLLEEIGKMYEEKRAKELVIAEKAKVALAQELNSNLPDSMKPYLLGYKLIIEAFTPKENPGKN